MAKSTEHNSREIRQESKREFLFARGMDSSILLQRILHVMVLVIITTIVINQIFNMKTKSNNQLESMPVQ